LLPYSPYAMKNFGIGLYFSLICRRMVQQVRSFSVQVAIVGLLPGQILLVVALKSVRIVGYASGDPTITVEITGGSGGGAVRQYVLSLGPGTATAVGCRPPA